MNNSYLAIIVVLLVVVAVLVLLGAVLIAFLMRRRRTEKLHEHFGPEYDRTVQNLGDERKAQEELLERQRRVESFDIRPLSADERDYYMAQWNAVQAKFVDDPIEAIIDADHLISDVMRARNYPVTDFDQRAADLSVDYPNLVNNYRAAREIAIKNRERQADTEELRQAMIYYKSLFEELLATETINEQENRL